MKKRKNPSGLEKFKELWSYSHIKVKLEIISYFYALKSKEWINYFKEGIISPVEEMVLLSVRMITKVKWDEAIQIVIERARNIPSHKIGSIFHKQLLLFLAKEYNELYFLPAHKHKNIFPLAKGKFEKIFI